MKEEMIETYMWAGIVMFCAVSLVVFVGIWTHNSFAWKIKCLESGGSYYIRGGCKVPHVKNN